jgi:hypothetical protein
MEQLPNKSHIPAAVLLAGLSVVVAPSRALAQVAPAVAPPGSADAPPPAGELAAPTAPQPPAPPPAASAIAPTPAVAAPAPAASPPPPPPPDPKLFSAGAWMRVGGRFQNPSTPNELNDFWLNELYLIAAFRGQFTDWLKWQINLNGNVPAPGTNMTFPSISTPAASYPSIGIQDLIVRIEPHELFNVWAGRMIVPFDRANLSGPWFINYWTFPGFFGNRPGAPVGPKTNQNGRDAGVTVWGQINKGMLKYYLGAFNLDNREHTVNPLVTGRVVIDLLDPEPGYYNQTAYHGDKDILAVGAGVQYQKNGVASASRGLGDLTNFNLELLADKKLGAAGVGTFEASGYFFDERQPIRRFFVLGAGYVTPQPIGVGRLCPAVRYQFTQDPQLRQIDVYVSYLIKSHFAKVFAGFFYADYPDAMPANPRLKSKAVQLGVQLIKF